MMLGARDPSVLQIVETLQPVLRQRARGSLYMGLMRLVREFDHLPAFNADVKNAWNLTSNLSHLPK